MPAKIVTLNVPDPLYARLQERARQANRSVEAEVLDVVTAAVPDNGLPDDYEDALTQLAMLDDEALKHAAAARFSPERASELEQLHLKRQRDGLTKPEAERAESLAREYELNMLMRAQATVLLKQRRHEIANPLQGA